MPVPVSTFIGRTHEIAAVKQRLSERRLVTLTGTGGSGKTRLALHVAEQERTEFPDGVWLVEFAPLQDAELVPQLIADALGVREQPGRSIADLVADFLQPRAMLLVLDNCEHLVHSVAQVTAKLLSASPGLKVLATSREPLGVSGEVVWPVPPLTLPSPHPWEKPIDGAQQLAAYRQSEAVRLFVDRAQAAASDFELNLSNAPWVAVITRRLDGMPLSIELAAARTTTLSAREIAERLDDRFALLTSHLSAVDPRHKTLRATLDWSHDLLSEAEQILFRRLAVFSGGWTLEAAEAVGAFGSIASADVMELLSGLVEKSLIMAERGLNRRRFYFLETVHQYAWEKLEVAVESGAARDQHLAYYLEWAVKVAPDIHGTGLSENLYLFDTEHDNLRTALDWSWRSDNTVLQGLRLAAVCATFWNARGHLNEGRSYLSRILDRPGAQEQSEERARALLAAGGLAWAQSDFTAARVAVQAALSISAQLGDQALDLLASANADLGDLYNDSGDFEESQIYLERALTLYTELGDDAQAAYVLVLLGWGALRQGLYDHAKTSLTKSLELQRDMGRSQLLGLTLAGLGQLNIRQAHYDVAQTYLTQSLELREAADYRWGIASTLGLLAWLMLEQQDFDRMRGFFRRSMAIRMALGQRGGIAWCLEKLGAGIVLESMNLPAEWRRLAGRRAVLVLGAAAALRADTNSAIDPSDIEKHEDLLQALRRELGEGVFDAVWAEGLGLDLEEAVDLALAPIEMPDNLVGPARAQSAKLNPGRLSRRERETAVLIAQGKSNREIAEAMVVREKTVETYVTRILNKLGFDSRVQVATWVFQRGLMDVNSRDT